MSSSTAARSTILPLVLRPDRTSTQISPKTVVGDCDCDSLIARMGGGDREALSELFRHFAPAIRNVGRRILRDGAESDDLVQDVFLYIHRKWDLFDSSKSNARSWIFQIAYTQAFLRRRQLKARGFYASSAPSRSLEAVLQTSPWDYDHTVEGLFGRNAWKEILESLTEDQRETLRLHFFEGYSFAEIAEKLGQSFANIRNHHYRGLEKLRKYLAGSASNRR